MHDSYPTNRDAIAGWGPRHTLGPEKGKFVSQLIFTRSESDKRNHRGVQDTFRHRIFGQSRGRIELLPHYDD